MEEDRGYIQFSTFSAKDVRVAQIHSISNEHRDSICAICSERVGDQLAMISYHIDCTTHETSSLYVAHLKHFFSKKDRHEQENETQGTEECVRYSRQDVEKPCQIPRDSYAVWSPLGGGSCGTPTAVFSLLPDGLSTERFTYEDGGADITERVPRVCDGVHHASERERGHGNLMEGRDPGGGRTR